MLAVGEAGTLLIALAFIALAENGSLEFAAMKAGAGTLAEYTRWAVFCSRFLASA